MKKKIIFAAALLLNLCACGKLDSEAVSGTWTLTQVNGASVEQYAAALGLEISNVAVNYTFRGDTALTEGVNGESGELTVQWQKDGLILQGTDFFTYNGENDTLTVDYGEFVCVFTRGKFEFEKQIN